MDKIILDDLWNLSLNTSDYEFVNSTFFRWTIGIEEARGVLHIFLCFSSLKKSSIMKHE